MIIPDLVLEVVSVGLCSGSRGPCAEADKKPVESIKPANRDAINRMGVKGDWDREIVMKYSIVSNRKYRLCLKSGINTFRVTSCVSCNSWIVFARKKAIHELHETHKIHEIRRRVPAVGLLRQSQNYSKNQDQFALDPVATALGSNTLFAPLPVRLLWSFSVLRATSWARE